MKTLKERLAYAMQTTGHTNQTELGRASGVPQSAISKILRGMSETSRHAGSLAAALGVSADWLINGNGTIFGSQGEQLPRIDVSRSVKVFDANGETGESVSWFSALPEHFRAYVIKGKTGISQIPAGSIVIVDPKEEPTSNSLVLVMVGKVITAFRYHIGGNGKGFLSVDDDRVPVSPVGDDSEILGPIVQLFVPELNK